jgi:hypothetical protein
MLFADAVIFEAIPPKVQSRPIGLSPSAELDGAAEADGSPLHSKSESDLHPDQSM